MVYLNMLFIIMLTFASRDWVKPSQSCLNSRALVQVSTDSSHKIQLEGVLAVAGSGFGIFRVTTLECDGKACGHLHVTSNLSRTELLCFIALYHTI